MFGPSFQPNRRSQLSKRGLGTQLATGVLISTLLATACSSSSSTKPSSSTTTSVKKNVDDDQQRRSVTVWPLAFVSSTPPKGVSSPLEVDMAPSSDHKLRVSFSEDEVSGTGDQWRAAAWNAVTVATILTGSQLRGREFTFKLRGRIDGPSAGTLMTIAVISLIRGDKLHDDITMTGTINPDGTTGPVGGIPYKVDGVVAAHKAKMLIPIGLRNAQDANGASIDVVQEGRDKNVAVSEVADIYDAYKQFSGVELPRPGSTGTVRLSERAYQNLKAKVDENIGQVKSDAAQIKTLSPIARQDIAGLLANAQTQITQAVKLRDEGLQGGAFSAARQASTLADAALGAGRLEDTYLRQGRAAFLTQLTGSLAIDDKVKALFETLKAFTPETVSDVSALVGAYGNATDALSLSSYGDSVLSTLAKASSPSEEATLALRGALYKELAGSLIGFSKDVFDVGRGLGGAKLQTGADVAGTADFFRKAAEANLQAFNTVVIPQKAQEFGTSEQQATVLLESKDISLALANSSLNVIEGSIDKFLEAEAKNYARLGSAIALYVRTAGLLDKYYSLSAKLGPDNSVQSVGSDAALANALDLAKSQVERSVSQLRAKQVDPTLVIGAYEIAGVERESTIDDKMSALADYRGAYITSRVLAYLGGFARDGMGNN